MACDKNAACKHKIISSKSTHLVSHVLVKRCRALLEHGHTLGDILQHLQ